MEFNQGVAPDIVKRLKRNEDLHWAFNLSNETGSRTFGKRIKVSATQAKREKNQIQAQTTLPNL